MRKRLSGDLFKDFMEHMLSGDKQEVLVGELPAELRQLHKQFEKVSDKLIDDIEHRVQELQLEANRKIKEEFDDRKDMVEDLKEEFWEQVYTHFNLDPDRHYRLKQGKTVFMEVDDEELDAAPNETGLH